MAKPRSRVRIHQPSLRDEKDFLAAVARSRALHHPWTAPPASAPEFRAHLARLREPGNTGFLVRRVDDDGLVGAIHVTNVVMGRFCSGYLGYYAFAGQERHGLMREGLLAVLRYAFRTMKLHRLEANIQPANLPSVALVRSCGFAQEGFSPRYLKVGGRWRDHERWAIVAS